MSTSMVPAPGSLSFWRIVDVPFETCVAALDSLLRAGHGGELRFGGSQLLGPMEHDRDLGTHTSESGTSAQGSGRTLPLSGRA